MTGVMQCKCTTPVKREGEEEGRPTYIGSEVINVGDRTCHKPRW